jgi:hypothetical protein
MVYPPKQLDHDPLSPPPHYRRVLWTALAVMFVAAVVLTAVALTRRTAPTGRGCIQFSFMTPTGGSSGHYCAATARALCLARVPTVVVNEDYYANLHAACRRARLPL